MDQTVRWGIWLRLVLSTAADVSDGRGDSIHIFQLYRHLRVIATTELVHRGRFLASAGPIASGRELTSVRGIFKTMTYHGALAIWLAHNGKRDDVIYCRDWSVALVATLLKCLRRFTIVYEANGLASYEIGLAAGRILGRLTGMLQIWVARRADGVVAVTSRLASFIIAATRRPASSTTTISNAGDATFTPVPTDSARTAIGIERGTPVVGFVGNLGPWQGLSLLLKAFEIYTLKAARAKLIIVGDGSEQAKLKQLRDQMGLNDSVRFVGSVPHDVALRYVCAFDVCVIPFEKSPMYNLVGRSPIKAYEYMACGKPIVAGSFDGLAEELVQSGCGIVVPPDDPPALARAFAQITSDPVVAAQMGANGREYVRTRKSWSGAAQALVSFCQGLVCGRAS